MGGSPWGLARDLAADSDLLGRRHQDPGRLGEVQPHQVGRDCIGKWKGSEAVAQKIRIEVRSVHASVGGSDPTYSEEYVCEGDPQKWAEALVAKFNATCRPGEGHRELVAVTVIGQADEIPHNWVKVSLATLETENGVLYDAYRCSRCGVTGKLFTLSGYVQRDREYRAKRYEKCRV